MAPNASRMATNARTTPDQEPRPGLPPMAVRPVKRAVPRANSVMTSLGPVVGKLAPRHHQRRICQKECRINRSHLRFRQGELLQ